MVKLGPFELQERIGSGGMGQIWRAVHDPSGIPVAIKAMKSTVSEAYREAFLHEVRLVAGLRHPNVILPFDAGTVPSEAARASNGNLAEGTPFLAMELAGGGALDRTLPGDWQSLRHVLLHLVEGLAHAHARGVIHRDIKPGNVLLAGARAEIASVPSDILSARIVLTDFGMGASPDTPEQEDGIASGTPSYMAPEQIHGAWRDQGPWTDLYAVGVVAFQLACGETPYRGVNAAATMIAHIQRPIPPLQALFDVPAGFESVVRQLMAKSPADRFAFAGEVRRALLALGEPVSGVRTRTRSRQDEDEEPTLLQAGSPQEISLITGSRSLPAIRGTGESRWREDEARDSRLVGAGLGLYGLRTLPMVNRVDERNALWEALVDVRATGQARAIVLNGASGTGKSRLARWLSIKCHEVAAGVALTADVASARSGVEVVAELAEQALRCRGLNKIDALERVASILGVKTIAGAPVVLAQMTVPGAFPDSPTVTRRESCGAMVRLLSSVAGEGCVVVVLEDVHANPDALDFARRLVDTPEGLPVLVVATVIDEALAESTEAEEALARLLAEPRAGSLTVEALLEADHRELVRVLLGLEGSAAVQVERRTAGNPQFAVQLVGDWVSRGLLTPSARGFRLSDDHDDELPRNLMAVWEQRVAAFLASRGDEDAAALEVAATLGMTLRSVDFRECCLLADIRPAPDLVDDFMRWRLARPVDERGERWTFAHGALREILLRRSREGGRSQAFNAVCAAHLRTLDVAAPDRLAAHLIAAGDPEAALEPLGQAIHELLAEGDFRSSASITRFAEVLEELDVPEEDPRRGELWLFWAWLYRVRGAHAEAERWVVRTERAARRNGWHQHLGRSLRMAARLERDLGQFDGAMALVEEASEVFAELGDDERTSACLTLIGDLWRQRGDLDRAQAAFERALNIGELPRTHVDPLKGLAYIAQKRGDMAAFDQALERAREAGERAGRRTALASMSNLQGEAARKRGDLDLAEMFYREAVARHRALDDAAYVYSALNVGLILALRGAWEEGIAEVEPIIAQSDRDGMQTVPGCFARVVLLACLAGIRDWRGFEDQCRWLETYLADRPLFDGDVALMAELAGKVSADSRPDAARAAWQIAIAQYKGLGDASAAGALSQRLERLADR